MARKKAVAKAGLAGMPQAVQDRIAAMQERFAGRERGVNSALSIKGKTFKFRDVDLGPEVDVILLDYTFVKQYYDTDYDPDEVSPPACFAISEEGEGLIPVESSPRMQGHQDQDGEQGGEDAACAKCWANQFGSADKGKGKACSDRRRVAVISASGYEEDGFVDTLTADNIAYLNFGGTSLKAWRDYVNTLGKAIKVPPFGVITTLSFVANAAHPQLEFRASAPVEDADVLAKCLDLVDACHDNLRQAPDFSSNSAVEEKPQGRRTTKKKKSRSKFAA